MDLVSIRMITDDLERAVEFYEQVTGVAAVRYPPVFAELVFPSFTLAIGHTQTAQTVRRKFRSPSR
jgi:catechol 2,3-dioxygenase-like lactoylglutathione lyase family enzyme